MSSARSSAFFASGLLVLGLALPGLAAQEREAAFAWPEGKRVALSLTFDDARPSQLDAGLPLLNAHGVKATFYVKPDGLRLRLDGWKAALAAGHEIGNHTQSHPCTGNYAFSRRNALEDYDLARIEAEMTGASRAVRGLLGVDPVSFAYPCGESFVGRGTRVRSYVPVVARLFGSGRGYLGESANDPVFCDLAQLQGVAFDELDFDQVRKLLETAASDGRWLVLAGHDIGGTGFQVTRTDTLESLCRYARDPVNGVWIDTVANIARHVREKRTPAGRRKE